MRTCLGCLRKRPKQDLVRLGLDQQSGCVLVDIRGDMKGRGGYACRECLPNLRLDKRIERAFRNRAKQISVVQGLDTQAIGSAVRPKTRNETLRIR